MLCDHVINKCSEIKLNEVAKKFKFTNESLTILSLTEIAYSHHKLSALRFFCRSSVTFWEKKENAEIFK